MQQQVGRYSASNKPLLIKAQDGKTLKRVAMSAFTQEITAQFNAPQTGFYWLEADAGPNAFMLQSANVPVALDATAKAVDLIGSRGSLYVVVPAEAKLFAFAIAGTDGEGVKATVINPSGSVVWMQESIFEIDRFTSSDTTPQSGVWQIKLERPVVGVFEDHSVDVLGTPGFLFLNPKRIWQ